MAESSDLFSIMLKFFSVTGLSVRATNSRQCQELASGKFLCGSS